MGQSILAFGSLGSSERINLSVVADKAGLKLRLTKDYAEALRVLDEDSPRLMLVENIHEHAEKLCLDARMKSDHAHMPIITVAKDIDDLSFAETYNWGGDDVISLSESWPLLARMRFLPKDTPLTSAEERGTALVADPDRGRRVVFARVLRNAGYTIKFALTPDDVATFVTSEPLRLVLLDSELDPGVARLVHECAAKSPSTIWIIKSAPKDLHEHREAIEGFANAAVTDGFAAPENVVFLANELSRGGASDKRSSRRLLYGTRIAFRGAGRETDELGYSYNISEGGIYVRTLAPPDESTVWLELRPPRTDSLIRLEGEIVWRRRFGPALGATVPPGFGFKLLDATRSSMQTWRYGYAAFAEMLGFPSLLKDEHRNPL